jgi:peptidoglycan hydrolase CwlO-like protein
MSEEGMQQFTETVGRLAGAAEALERMLGRIEAQQQELSAKVAVIVAAVEEKAEQGVESTEAAGLEARVAELEKANADLKAQAARAGRKTLPPMVSVLLNKFAGEGEHADQGALDKALRVLSVDQRIAVKAEMARAGMLE